MLAVVEVGDALVIAVLGNVSEDEKKIVPRYKIEITRAKR